MWAQVPPSARSLSGKSGEDLTIKVPLGTIIKDASTGRVLADLSEKGEKELEEKELLVEEVIEKD